MIMGMLIFPMLRQMFPRLRVVVALVVEVEALVVVGADLTTVITKYRQWPVVVSLPYLNLPAKSY